MVVARREFNKKRHEQAANFAVAPIHWRSSVAASGLSKDGRIIHPYGGATSNFAVTMWSREGRAPAFSEGDQVTAGRGG